MSPARTPPEQRRFWTWLWWRLFALVGGAVIVGATVGLWFFVPFWVIVAAVVSTRVPGRWRPLRLFCLLLLHLTLESLVLLSLLGLWLGSGLGLLIRRPFFQWCHYDVMHWYLRNLFREAMRVLRLRIVTAAFPLTAALPGLFQFAAVRGSLAEPLVCSAPPSRPSAPGRLAGGAALPPETLHRFAPSMSHASSYRRLLPRRTALAQPLRW